MAQSEFVSAGPFEKVILVSLFGVSMLLLLWAARFEPTPRMLSFTGGLATMMCAAFAERRTMRLSVHVGGLAILMYSLFAG